jgi:hypothetical protein
VDLDSRLCVSIQASSKSKFEISNITLAKEIGEGMSMSSEVGVAVVANGRREAAHACQVHLERELTKGKASAGK